jgi:trehalose 6-phosphate synthase
MISSKNPDKLDNWKSQFILGYYNSVRDSEIALISSEINANNDLYFINYKNSLNGTGGVGTVTRSILKIFPYLKMVCYDSTIENSYKLGDAEVIPIPNKDSIIKAMHANYSKLFLWPILHGLPSEIIENELSQARRDFISGSKVFSEGVNKSINEDKNPIIWINDYVLSGTVKYIRERFPDRKIIFSWRTPFGTTSVPNFSAEDVIAILSSVIQADIITFHRKRDVINFLLLIEKYSLIMPNTSVNWQNHTIKVGEHTSIPRAIPMGNDPTYRKELSNSVECVPLYDSYKEIKGSTKLIVSISRFEKSKGIENELDAISMLLKLYPHLKTHITFLRVSYVSQQKQETSAYVDFYNFINEKIQKINEEFACDGWVPIVSHLDKKLDDYGVTSLFKATDIFLLMSQADGFNHMALESVLSKNEQDCPIQLLVGDIGVSDYINGYVKINQLDPIDCAIKLHESLNRGLSEVIEDQKLLQSTACKLSATNWALSIIQAAIDIEKLPVIKIS